MTIIFAIAFSIATLARCDIVSGEVSNSSSSIGDGNAGSSSSSSSGDVVDSEVLSANGYSASVTSFGTMPIISARGGNSAFQQVFNRT